MSDPMNANDMAFKTRRLSASAMRDEDADESSQILNNALVASSFFPSGNIRDLAPASVQLGFRMQSSDALIGLASIKDGHIAYCVRHESWGQGFGAEIVASLVTVVAPALQIPELRALVFRENIRSRRLLEGQDFAFSGLVTIRCGSRPGERAALAYRKRVG